jgi:hypothetical protein
MNQNRPNHLTSRISFKDHFITIPAASFNLLSDEISHIEHLKPSPVYFFAIFAWEEQHYLL